LGFRVLLGRGGVATNAASRIFYSDQEIDKLFFRGIGEKIVVRSLICLLEEYRNFSDNEFKVCTAKY
jgi:hypothetical protein